MIALPTSAVKGSTVDLPVFCVTNSIVLFSHDFLLHTITDEREIKILFELLEKRNEQRKSTIVCSQRDLDNWKAMILNDEVSANSIMKRATKHYTIKINTR